MAGEDPNQRTGVFEPADSAGLFVGVSVFEDGRIASIPFAVDDAVDLAYLFIVELGLVPSMHAVLLLAGEPRKEQSAAKLLRLLELGVRRQEARQREIYRLLTELSQTSGVSGILIVTAATHGVSDQGGDFLLASDSLRNRTLRTGVAVAEVFDEVGRAGAERRVVLLDACRERLTQGTRGIEGAPMSKTFAKAIGQAKGMVILSGATLGGYAYDDPVRCNGVFTAAILDGLSGEASAGEEGWITARTLADFVQKRVADWIRRNCPEDAFRSLGIGRRIEANADALPLAPHPGLLAERFAQSQGQEGEVQADLPAVRTFPRPRQLVGKSLRALRIHGKEAVWRVSAQISRRLLRESEQRRREHLPVEDAKENSAFPERIPPLCRGRTVRMVPRFPFLDCAARGQVHLLVGDSCFGNRRRVHWPYRRCSANFARNRPSRSRLHYEARTDQTRASTDHRVSNPSGGADPGLARLLQRLLGGGRNRRRQAPCLRAADSGRIATAAGREEHLADARQRRRRRHSGERPPPAARQEGGGGRAQPGDRSRHRADAQG